MLANGGFLVTQNVVARLASGLVGALALAGVVVTAQQKAPTIVVYKTPTCGCCTKWVEHLQAAGFTVQTQHRDDLTIIRQTHKVPPTATSCHTALVGPYVVEGHVPAADVKRMLAEQPKIKGIAVAGMPVGSPGMEGPAPQKYDTVAFTEAGKITVFAKH
ncbi:CopG family transcriptional regulator [Luteitalea sp. TBR-22]|nr:CopG family transcriptional regulator [Luteitalea sp. TBR-22]